MKKLIGRQSKGLKLLKGSGCDKTKIRGCLKSTILRHPLINRMTILI